MTPRAYSRDEEIAHCVTHGVGVVASVAAMVALLLVARHNGVGAWRAAGGVIFSASALLLFTTSVLYHGVRMPQFKPRLRLLDHSAIYVLIAGSYTPFALGVLGGNWGWTLFALVWGCAVLGIVAKTVLGFRFQLGSTLMYLAMGWMGVIAAKPLLAALTTHEIKWIVAGGLAYTLGVPFYLWKSRRYTHAVWHLFVLAGVACHFVAVLSVMAPRPG